MRGGYLTYECKHSLADMTQDEKNKLWKLVRESYLTGKPLYLRNFGNNLYTFSGFITIVFNGSGFSYTNPEDITDFFFSFVGETQLFNVNVYGDIDVVNKTVDDSQYDLD